MQVCIPDEASRQSNGVCVRYTPYIDFLILALNIYVAVDNRGTAWGWLATAFALFYIWLIIKAIRES